LIAWFDVPVRDLARARAFYEAVLGWKTQEVAPGVAVFEHDQSMTGGCLNLDPDSAPTAHGALLYYNVTGRHGEAEALVPQYGGEVLAPKHAIGPFGYRSLILDSEGNRLALHSAPEVA
jgi:predicted enzyme related to lactoylglutathione lyase